MKWEKQMERMMRPEILARLCALAFFVLLLWYVLYSYQQGRIAQFNLQLSTESPLHMLVQGVFANAVLMYS
jgi:hypothetical protein